MKRTTLSALCGAALLVACSSTSRTADPGVVSGTLGGRVFTFASGIAYLDGNGSLNVMLSDFPRLCDSVKLHKLHAGEAVVQAYGLKGSAPGTFSAASPAMEDIKYASVGACSSGQPVESSIAKKSDDTTTSEITISKLGTTQVEGRLTLDFADGSSVSGSFFVPICPPPTDGAKSTCY